MTVPLAGSWVCLPLGGGHLGLEDFTLGPDGNVYVTDVATNNVKKFNGTTGAFIGVFASGGGLNLPQGLSFGPDGNLYVASALTNQVLRYNGTTGAFMNVFATGS